MRRTRAGTTGSAIVVGGSLTGLALAIALSRIGIGVTVVEQNRGQDRGGTGLGIDRELLSAVTGIDATKSALVKELPVIRTQRETSTWHAIQEWLRAAADVAGNIEVLEGARVESVVQDASGAGVRGNFEEIRADVVLGADGYRSVVRRAVDPGNPTALYGGFMIWRGLVEESWLGELATARIHGGLLPFADCARLVAYRVPGRDGSTEPGRRQITFAWYDASRSAWLRSNGYLEADEVLASIPNQAIDAKMHAEFRNVALTRWRSPERDVLLAAIDHHIIFGTPLAEFLPARMCNGRVAIAGDAAHVASPMVGAGLANGFLDCLALAQSISDAGGTGGASAERALKAYESAALRRSRSHVRESLDATQSLLRSVAP
jgi:2-polyprenyl-6-methoxyphenol hydroxylase-like FAD-dependent oxidoreductase